MIRVCLLSLPPGLLFSCQYGMLTRGDRRKCCNRPARRHPEKAKKRLCRRGRTGHEGRRDPSRAREQDTNQPAGMSGQGIQRQAKMRDRDWNGRRGMRGYGGSVTAPKHPLATLALPIARTADRVGGMYDSDRESFPPTEWANSRPNEPDAPLNTGSVLSKSQVYSNILTPNAIPGHWRVDYSLSSSSASVCRRLTLLRVLGPGSPSGGASSASSSTVSGTPTGFRPLIFKLACSLLSSSSLDPP